MKKKFKLGIIGAGFMSSAIVKGVINSNLLSKAEICVSDTSFDALDKMNKLGLNTTNDNLYLANNSEFVLFAVKPQSLSDVIKSLINCSCNKFISIMAGVKKKRIKDSFNKALVARCMPNTPCSIGKGAIGLDLSDYTSIEDKDFICSLFSALGQVVIISEERLNTVTGISGSSPAYFYLFVKGIIDAGVKKGLDYEQAKLLAVSTMIGSGNMILSNPDKSIDELINAVCSKGGTTIEAVNSFENARLNDIIYNAINACIERSIELENI